MEPPETEDRIKEETKATIRCLPFDADEESLTWLNQNEKKIVIAPEKWMNKNLINDPICNDWMRVKS